MGQAGRAPDASYRRMYTISRHALDRFRERVDEEFTARPDSDLGNLLDERIRHSLDRTTVIDTDAPDIQTWIVKIENRAGSIDYAILRQDTVVTVLDDHMLQVNYNSGRWKRGPLNPVFRDVLAGLKVPSKEPILVPAPKATLPPPTPVTVVDVNDAIVAAGIAIAMTSLAYQDALDVAEAARLAYNAAQAAIADADFRKTQAAAHLVTLIADRKNPK